MNVIINGTEIFVDLLQKKQEILFDVLKTLRQLLQHKDSLVRTLSCRLIRKCSISAEILAHIEPFHMHFFIVRCLEQRSEFPLERIEALKIVYNWVQLSSETLPRAIVQSLIAISRHKIDPLRVSALLTLTEITLRNVELIAKCGGITIICECSIDPDLEHVQNVLLRCILALLNSPEKSQFIAEGDLNLILSPFISLFEQSITKESFLKFKASKKAIELLLRDWGGLIFLAKNPNGLKSFLSTLRLPSKKVKLFAIEMLYKLFFLEIPRKNSEQTKTRIARYSSMKKDVGASYKNIWGDINSIFPLKRSPYHNLLENYLAILLVSFMDVGLFEALVEVGKESSTSLSFYVSHFLSEVLHNSRHILSSRLCTILQSLPSLFEIAASFTDRPFIRVRASRMLSELDRFARKKKKKSAKDFHITLIVNSIKKNIKSKNVNKNINSNKLGIGMGIDDNDYDNDDREPYETTSQIIKDMKIRNDQILLDQEFDNKIKECKVISTEDHTKWNFHTIVELVQITENNQKYFENCLKNKFFKNLLNFFDPRSDQFCNIKRTIESLSYVAIGVQLLRLLLSNPDGFEFLKNSTFCSSLNEALIIENDGTSSNKSGMKRLFTPTRMSKTLTKEYFTLIGSMTQYDNGMNLLLSKKIIHELERIVKTKGRSDLALPIIISLDYNKSSMTQDLLADVLNYGSKLSRLQGIEHLKLLWRAGVNDFSTWAVEILVKQLHDKDQDIATAALDLLDECCIRSPKCFDTLVSCNPPDLEKFGMKGEKLLLCILSTQKGLSYLKQNGYFDEKLKYWVNEGCLDYVKDLDIYLSAIFDKKSFPNKGLKQVTLRPHFFGELAKTKQGIQILHKRQLLIKWFKILKNSIKNPNSASTSTSTSTTSSTSSTSIKTKKKINQINIDNKKIDTNKREEEIDNLQIRAILWTIGNISTSGLGYSAIEKYSPIEIITEMAINSNNLPIRATSLYVLGLMSSLDQVRLKLDELGWEYPKEKGRMIVIPMGENKKKFFNFPKVKYLGSYAKHSELNITLNFIGNKVQQQIFNNIRDLGNRITEEATTKNLLKLKAEYPEYFLEPYLFYRTYRILDFYRYRLNIRKLIHHLFKEVYFNEQIFQNFTNESLVSKETSKLNQKKSKKEKNEQDLSDLFILPNQQDLNKQQKQENENNGVTLYSLERLRSLPRPNGVNSRNILHFLKLEDFQRAFGLTKEQFLKLPKWKQIHKRKEWGLN
ncbi:cytosolic regulator pianissimo [Anaeramoeba flamelloides]|uniref:Cytosolic regulator pianissimo n=1 Tax=Anaeramoeba flamelloides TaxID=1746091 RepID=A0AAV7ZMH9_9EUKA|nr:cytosolic regulator pianissimo [Anaeramoeba flamelloides]